MLNQWMNLGVPHFQTSDTLERVGKKVYVRCERDVAVDVFGNLWDT